MTKEELRAVLEAHAAWLRGEGGKRADLIGADLIGADLRSADLRSANLRGAILADGVTAKRAPDRRAMRSDGHEFFLWNTSAGWRIRAGCRFFAPEDAWKHWEDTRAGTPLGDETFDILTMFELHMERSA